MDELLKDIQVYHRRLESIQAAVHIPEKRQRLDELKSEMALPDFWNERIRAQKVSQEVANLERSLQFWHSIGERIRDLEEMAAEDSADTNVSLLADLREELHSIQADVAAKETEIWLQEPHDASPAIVTIYSGAGGVDAQDWALMLERMYLRFADRQGWEVKVLQRTPGQEAGIKNVTLRFQGAYAYGYLRPESGVHRLVRLSPYDADQARHTSFAMVEVLPELEETTSIEVPKEDVRIDVYRSSGHGGQSVNTTDSAVRLTHIPTGITVAMQNERSQTQNKEQAWKILLGKLERYYAAQREEERLALRGELTEAAWGNQIRSYVLHPYKMVKDHRTKYESKNPDDVLDGDLMPFIEAELRRFAHEKG